MLSNAYAFGINVRNFIQYLVHHGLRSSRSVTCILPPERAPQVISRSFCTLFRSQRIYFARDFPQDLSCSTLQFNAHSQISFTNFIHSVSVVLKAHDNFISPPANFSDKQHELALLNAKNACRAAFVKMTTDKSDAKREVAIGALSADDISKLHKLARKITWPLLGVGTVASIIGEILRGTTPEMSELKSEDISKAVKYLERPCSELNALCREGLEHVLCTLQLGKYASPSVFGRLFSRKTAIRSDSEDARDIGTDTFVARFDSGLAAFKDQRTNNIAQFFDDKEGAPSRGLFLVLYVEFLLYSTAQEIRGLVVFSDQLRSTGVLKRTRLILPKVKLLRKAFEKLVRGGGPEGISGQEFGADEGDVFSDFTGRVNRNSLLSCGSDFRNGG